MIWQDRNMSECFKVFYVKLYVRSLVDKLKWFCENARCYNKIWCMKFPRNTVKQLIVGFVNIEEVKAILYLRGFARIFYVFYKSRKGDVHERLLGDGERRENRWFGSHTFLRGVHEFLSELSTSLFRPGWNSAWDIFTHCCRSRLSFVKIADVKALNFWHRGSSGMLHSVDWQFQHNRLVP